MVWQVIYQGGLGVVMDYVLHSNLHFPTAVAYIIEKKNVALDKAFFLPKNTVPVQVYGLTTCLEMNGTQIDTHIVKSRHNVLKNNNNKKLLSVFNFDYKKTVSE